MKRYLPILFGLIALLLVNISAVKNEQLISSGQRIFVKLQPVDPRSLIQGDYMALSYAINLDVSKVSQAMLNKDHQLLVVTLDQQSRLVSSDLADSTSIDQQQHLLKVKRNPDSTDWDDQYYPASNSYLFAEGLEWCYSQATYADLRVDEAGNALLYQLTDDKLIPLNCEAQ